MKTTNKQNIELLLFYYAKQCFAIPFHYVKKVIAPFEFTPLPHVASYVEGLINLQGEILPLISLQKLFQIDGKNEGEQRWIICQLGPNRFALEVGFVSDIVEIDQETLDLKAEKNQPLIYGEIVLQEKAYSIFDVDAFVKSMQENHA